VSFNELKQKNLLLAGWMLFPSVWHPSHSGSQWSVCSASHTI
jgi:hypothetical protein